jgi:hypothetical protein
VHLNNLSRQTTTNQHQLTMTLLEQAKNFPNRRLNRKGIEITNEVIELAFAWLKDEVKDVEVRRVLANDTGLLQQSYPTIARALKQAYKDGKLTLRD